jgi:hypothetical protein
MGMKHLTTAIARRFEAMPRKERVAKVRKLAGTSPEDKKFVRETFPDLYREAFASRRPAAGGRSGATRRRGPTAARR